MAPTGAQVISYAMSQRATWAKGRKRENVNAYTIAYYGNETPASWCEIFEYEVFAHFPGGATLFKGKSAFVPNMPSHFGNWWHHPSSKSIYPGCPVALGLNNVPGPEHTGLFVRWANDAHTEFVCIEGNTVVGNSNDAVDDKTRYWSSVTGWAKIPFPKPDPSVYPGIIYRYRKGKPLMHDSHVGWIQQHVGFTGKAVDDIYGPKTAAAVGAFQHKHKLTEDDEVGPITWKALAHA